MANWIVIDTVTSQGYGTYQASTGALAVFAALSDYEREPEDGDIYHVYQLLSSGHALLNSQSVEWPVDAGGI